MSGPPRASDDPDKEFDLFVSEDDWGDYADEVRGRDDFGGGIGDYNRRDDGGDNNDFIDEKGRNYERDFGGYDGRDDEGDFEPNDNSPSRTPSLTPFRGSPRSPPEKKQRVESGSESEPDIPDVPYSGVKGAWNNSRTPLHLMSKENLDKLMRAARKKLVRRNKKKREKQDEMGRPLSPPSEYTEEFEKELADDAKRRNQRKRERDRERNQRKTRERREQEERDLFSASPLQSSPPLPPLSSSRLPRVSVYRSSAEDISMGNTNIVRANSTGGDTVSSGGSGGTGARVSSVQRRRRRVDPSARDRCLLLYNRYVANSYMLYPFCSKILFVQEAINYMVAAREIGETENKIEDIITEYFSSVNSALNNYRTMPSLATDDERLRNNEKIYRYMTVLHKLRCIALIARMTNLRLIAAADADDDIKEEVDVITTYPFEELPTIYSMYTFTISDGEISERRRYPKNDNFDAYKEHEDDMKEVWEGPEPAKYYMIYATAKMVDTNEVCSYIVYHGNGIIRICRVRSDTGQTITDESFNISDFDVPNIRTTNSTVAIAQHIIGCITYYISWELTVNG